MKTCVYHMLQPIIQTFAVEYVQVISDETFSSNDADFAEFLQSKLNECEESTVPSLVVIFIDQLVGSKPSYHEQSSVTKTVGEKQEDTTGKDRKAQKTKQEKEDTKDEKRVSESKQLTQRQIGTLEHEVSAIKQQLKELSSQQDTTESQDSSQRVAYSQGDSWNYDQALNASLKTNRSVGETDVSGDMERHDTERRGTLVRDFGTDDAEGQGISKSQMTHKGFTTCIGAKRAEQLRSQGSREEQERKSRSEARSVGRNVQNKYDVLQTTVQNTVLSTEITASGFFGSDYSRNSSVAFAEETIAQSAPFQLDILNSLSVMLKSYANRCSREGEKIKPFVALVVQDPMTFMWVKASLNWGQIPGSIPTTAHLFADMMKPDFLKAVFSKCAFTLRKISMNDHVRHEVGSTQLCPSAFLTWLAGLRNNGQNGPLFKFPQLTKLKLLGMMDFTVRTTGLDWNQSQKEKLINNLRLAFPRLEKFVCRPPLPENHFLANHFSKITPGT